MPPKPAQASATALQAAFDEELRRRIRTGETSKNGYRSPMRHWAMTKLRVTPEVATTLWMNRSQDFKGSIQSAGLNRTGPYPSSVPWSRRVSK